MKLWKGRFTKTASQETDEFNASITFDSRMYAEDIAKIITETEEIQDSNESAYTKEMAMINAYFNIVLLVGSE